MGTSNNNTLFIPTAPYLVVKYLEVPLETKPFGYHNTFKYHHHHHHHHQHHAYKNGDKYATAAAVVVGNKISSHVHKLPAEDD